MIVFCREYGHKCSSRSRETTTADELRAGGWRAGEDGWLCPVCARRSPDIGAMLRRGRESYLVVAVVGLVGGLVLGALLAQCAGCSDDATPAADAALPACDELPGCDVALCNTAGVCQCRRPGLPPVECRR